MIDTSDEATELPPLNDVTVEHSLVALRWTIGTEGLVTLEGEDMPVHYLSVRGLGMDEDGAIDFQQLHIAMPTDDLRPLLEAWLERLS
jgi:hypothetical protein